MGLINFGFGISQQVKRYVCICIVDDLNKKLILARDPFGIKPLYYSIKNGVCYFASQVKSLRSIHEISNEKSEAGIVNFYM